MPQTLDEKREQMIGFLLENIICRAVLGKRQIKKDGIDVVFTDKEGQEYSIRTLSRQLEFPYSFENDPKRFDEDRRRLKAILDHVASFTREKNRQGYVPGFVFLAADTDFSQLKERTTRIVNSGHFLKQVLPSDVDAKPSLDTRMLDPLELAVEQFYRNNEVCQKQRTSYAGSEYYPGLIYFNAKKNGIDVVWFMDVADATEFRYAACPICKLTNGPQNDHSGCKRTKEYIDEFAKPRDIARYVKAIRIMKHRTEIESRCQSPAEKGVRFQAALLDAQQQYIAGETLYIALIK
jgi:hypothetical protein